MLKHKLFFLLFYLFSHLSSIEAKQVLLLNDTSAWYHWGCTGTSTALREKIEHLGFDLVTVPINQTYAFLQIPETPAEFREERTFSLFCEANPDLLTRHSNR